MRGGLAASEALCRPDPPILPSVLVATQHLLIFKNSANTGLRARDTMNRNPLLYQNGAAISSPQEFLFFFANCASSRLMHTLTQFIDHHDYALEMLLIFGGGGMSLNVKDPLSPLICIILF